MNNEIEISYDHKKTAQIAPIFCDKFNDYLTRIPG